MKTYTVIGICTCCGDNVLTELVRAVSPTGAAFKALEQQVLPDTKILAVFEGRQQNLIDREVTL